MSDFTSIKAQLQTLIDNANAKTERTDADLTTAVGALIEGYGAGESIPDGESVTFGYVKKTTTTPAPDGKAYYNDVLLPKIPDEILAEYPYIIIVKSSKGSTRLVGSTKVIYKGVQSNVPAIIAPEISAESYLSEDGSEWGELSRYNWGTASVLESPSANKTYYSLIWSRCDIPDGSADATEIYYYGSEQITEIINENYAPAEREPLYSVTSDNLNDIAYKVGQLAGNDELLTPEQIIAKLDELLSGTTE